MKYGKRLRCLFSAIVALAITWFVVQQNRQTESAAKQEGTGRIEALSTEPPAASAAAPAVAKGVIARRPLQGMSGDAWHSLTYRDNEAVFEQFADWSERYARADETRRGDLEAEGLQLARQRRAAMAATIQTDPQRALELAMPETERASLPASIRAQLEEHVSGRGNYDVLAAIPLPGQRLGVPVVQRSFKLGERVFETFVYGHRLDAPTKRNIPLYGVALDQQLAVHEDSVRVMSTAEITERQAAAAGSFPLAEEAVCGVSGLEATVVSEPVAAVVGNEIVWLCRYDHAEFMNERLKIAAHKLGGVDGSGTVTGETAESPYTEGRKRLIMIRVAFSNLPTPDISSNQLVTVHAAIDTYWRINSYGKTSAAELGRGSDIVQVTLANPYQTYDDDAGAFRDDVRAAATAAGIDFGRYDFDIIYSGGGRPSFSFGGLGYVGAPGSWVVGASRGITAHELGHNLGFPHANFWDTGGLSAIGPGGNQEYGDPFDVMGGGGVDDGTGPGHYVSKFKWRIGWIDDANFPRITTSGTHRIYAHDNPDTRNLRGVRFRRDASLDYFLEFRQRYINNIWMMNGIGLRWGSTGGSSSQLIDTTPGTPDGKNDSLIVIGRTFSDPSSPVHITPLGLANTYPPSIDVRVNIGSFTGNQPPSFTLVPSTSTSSVGGGIAFTAANATDPNNDALAYWWDFGDGTFSTDNKPVVTNAFRSAGEYVVRCVVSDMKGGTASESTVVYIGRPTGSIYSIRGRVLYNGQPAPDVLVKASSSRYAYTDSDGSYEITRLTAGSYTVSAQLDPHTFVHPFFNNPVTVGPADAENIDFLRVIAPQNDVSLIPNNAAWKYLDNGSNQGTNWSQPGFDDSSWASGPAELGYGDDDEATELSFGGNTANKYITYYFRRLVNIPDPTALTNFTLNFLRDDGGIVYINGREVLRDNMPDVAVNYLTRALDGDEESTATAIINSSYFVPGTNVIAAEIHQDQPTSSDISFNLWMTATTATNFSGLNSFYIAQPQNNAIFTSPTNLTVRANADSTGGGYALVEFFADGIKLDEATTEPFEVPYDAPAEGVHRLTAVATLASGSKLTSAPVTITVIAPVTWVTLIGSNATWRYNDQNQNLGAAWREADYPDTAWSSGPAQLGFGDTGIATILQAGPTGARTPTFYFRHAFTVEDAGLVTDLVATLFRDDGVVLYLNGIEVSRVLMPSGSIAFSTYASGGVDANDEIAPVVLDIPTASLVDGVNVLAAEVHQQSATSSDVRFGLQLVGTVSGAPAPGVRITAPLAGSSHRAGDSLELAATAIGQDITAVEFYRNGALLGQDSTVPYRFDWLLQGTGPISLTAVAREAGGLSYTSAPVEVTLVAPKTGRELVALRSLWRYSDDGDDPGATWAQRNFNDSAWSKGYARLGYGNDGETTVVNFGADAAKRHITTHFRHAFSVGSVAGISNLKLLLSRDDGAVVYLNGTEIYRNNLPPGTVSYNSLAAATIDAPEETSFLVVTTAANNLIIGSNVIAVEIHQESIQSPDLGFDLALIAESAADISDGIYLTAPAEGTRVTLPATIPLEAFAVSMGESISKVEFFVDGASIAEDLTFPYSAAWPAAGVGNHAIRAVAYRPSATVTSATVHVIVQGPPVQVSPVLTTFIPTGSGWRYWPNAAAPPANWNSPDYGDAGWSPGIARFGFGLDGETTTLPSGRNAYYFRRLINVANPAMIDELIFQLQRDDGAVVYLNGVEVYRSNMPAGSITGSTAAGGDAVGLDEQQFFINVVPASGLQAGLNLVAVEVHQSSPGSSDIGFDMHLSGSGDTSPRILMSRPGTGSQFVIGAPITLEAAAWAGQGRSVNSVDFLANGAPLAQVTTAPYTFNWNSPTQGTYTVVARLTDNFGDTVTSRAVSFNVGYEVVRTNFIAAGSVWKYLDNGSNQGTNFAQLNYNDSGWASGPAQLGYGDGDEATTVGFGGNTSAKFITTYFRRAFEAPPGWTITNLSFRLMRDDGAVVWMNGRELYRSNMLTGAHTYLTPAQAAVDAANESAFFESTFTVTNLPATNVIAVEIHQSGGSSSDISFDLEVVGTGFIPSTTPPGGEPPTLVFSAAPPIYTVANPPVRIDTNASVLDSDSLDFDAGRLTVTVISNAAPGDVIGIQDIGMGDGQIGLSNNLVCFGGMTFAAQSGGSNAPLVLQFNSAATLAVVQSLVAHLTFHTTNYSPLRRTLDFTLSDGDGGVSDPTPRHVMINRRPWARYDRAATAHDVPIVLSLTRLLRNDADPDGDAVSVIALDAASDEGATMTATETNITYLPRAGFAGHDFFTYRVADGRGGEANGLVAVWVVADREIMIDELVPGQPGGSGYARIIGAGQPGNLYVIYASTDYALWTLIGNSQAGPDGLLQFLDHEADSHPVRFYRMEIP